MRFVMENIGDSLPDKCPVCGEDLTWDRVDLVCKNPNCMQKDYRDLECWIGYLGDIDNLGNSWKMRFLDEFSVETVEDIYLTDFGESKQDDGTHKKLFYEMIKKLKVLNVNPVRALCALNIPRLGSTTANKLASSDYMRNGFIKDIKSDSVDFTKIATIVGYATGKSIEENKDKLHRLTYVYDRFVFEDVKDKSDMKKVAITGALSVKRSEFEKLLNDNGFVLSGIGKDTMCLITDNPNSGSAKNAAADKLGVLKMTELEFRAKYL